MSWNPIDAAAHAAKSVGHAVAETGRAVANEIYDDTGLKRMADDHRRADAAKRGDQRRRELENQGSGLRGETQGGYDAAAITSTTNWQGMGHGGIHNMLQNTVKPGGINDAGVALADVGKGLAQDHDAFHHELDNAIKSGWQGTAASAANNAAAPMADWGRQMGASLELTGNHMQLVSAAAQQAKDTVPPPTSTNLKEGLLAAGASMIAGPVGGLVGGAMDLKQQSDRAKADQQRAVQVMTSVYTSTYVEADSTTPAFAQPVDPTAPPSDQPPPRRVDPPPGNVPPSGVPVGRGYQPAALRPSSPSPRSGYVPPPGLNPQQALAQQQQQALARQQAELARQRQPMGTSQQGFDPYGPPGGQSSGGPYGGGSYGGGQYGSQSGGGVGSVPFGPLGSGGGSGGVGAGGRVGAGGGSGQSGMGPGGRAGVGGPGGSGAAGARGMGGAGARGAGGASGMGMGGGAGGRGGRGEEDGEHRSASYLVNADNGNEIVGDLGKVAPPVIGEG